MYKVLLFALFCFPLSAQVTINEYSASNLREVSDNYFDQEDYIELYNPSAQPVDISGWHLSDKLTNPKKWAFPQGTVLPSDSYLIVWASGRNETRDGHLHTNFKLKQTAPDQEYVVLADRNGIIIESTPLVKTDLHHSICKTVNGGDEWAVCTTLTPLAGNEASAMYTVYAPDAKIVTQRGWYRDSVVVRAMLSDAYDLRYTLDGNIPTDTSQLMPDFLVIKKTAVLTVRNFSADADILPGKVDFATFFINEPKSTLPIFSVAGGDEAIALAEGDRQLNPISSLELFDKDGVFITFSHGELDGHGQDSWVNDQRSLDWISRDEMGISSAIGHRLFNSSERNEFQRIIFRASGDDNYPAVDDPEHEGSTHIRDEYVQTLVQNSDMHLDIRSVERCLLYINGKYWGVYTIREKPDDHDYTSFRYDQDKYDIQFLKTWGQSWAEYGGAKAITDWENFRDSILAADVSQSAEYSRIKDKLDVTSLMDYMIINLSVVSSDWLNYNTGWWRGLKPDGKHKKWAYIMWDNDATFDYYINYSGVPDTSPFAQACDIEEIGYFMDEFFPPDTSQVIYPADSFFWNGEWVYWGPDTFDVFPDLGKHEKIFLHLLENNNEFRNTYFARYADMISTVFTCENMKKTLDSLLAIVRPEMPRHISRWGGSMTEWDRNVKKLKTFVENRCKRIDDGLADCYQLSGPYPVTLMTNPPGMGDIKFNTLTHKNLPWVGTYFGNMDNTTEVIPTTPAKFLYWQSKNGSSAFSNSNSPASSVTITAADTLIAVFENAVNTHDQNVLMAFASPNPGTGTITVTVDQSLDNSLIHVTDNTGKSVYKKAGFSGNATTLDLQFLPAGMYHISLHDKYRSYRTKWIKI